MIKDTIVLILCIIIYFGCLIEPLELINKMCKNYQTISMDNSSNLYEKQYDK